MLHWDWDPQSGSSSVGQWNATIWEISNAADPSRSPNWSAITPQAYDQVGLTVKVRHTVTGLNNGTAYSFTVRARNASGTSGNSNTVSATPSDRPAPGKPTLTAESNVPGGVTLTGQVDASYAVTGWQVQRDGGTWEPVNEPQRPPQLLVTFVRGLTWDTAYKFKVRALNGTATGAESAEVSVTTKGKNDAVPAAPADLEAYFNFTSNGQLFVFLTWLTPAATITEYHLLQNGERVPGALSSSDALRNSLPARVATLTGLNAGASYTFNVRAKNSNGTGPWSETVRLKIDPVWEAPGKPTLRVHAYDTAVGLDFSTPWYPDRMRPVTSWQYSRSPKANSSDPDWNTMTLPGFSDLPTKQEEPKTGDRAQFPPGFLVTGLANGTEYTFKVRAVNSVGNGAESDAAQATPSKQSCWDPDADGTPTCEDRAVPTAPVLSGTAGNAQVTLTWQDGVYGYPNHWEYQQGAGTWTDVAGSNIHTRSATVTGLTNSTEYTFQVRGVSSNGNGAASNTVNLTPVGGGGGRGGAGGQGSEGAGTDGESTDGSGTPVPALPLPALALLAALLGAAARHREARLNRR